MHPWLLPLGDNFAPQSDILKYVKIGADRKLAPFYHELKFSNGHFGEILASYGI